MQPSTLTMKGISTTMESNTTPIILQVINLQNDLKEIETGKAYISEISDGYAKLKCYWASSLYEKIKALEDKFNGAIVVVKSYVAATKKILVSAFEMVCLYDEVIGDPISYKEYLTGLQMPNATNIIDPEKAIMLGEDIVPASKPSNGTSKVAENKENSNKNTLASSFRGEKMKMRQVNAYQTIEDLYPTLNGWTLYCRVNKVSYREFDSKKNGKKIQLLEFEMRDRNDWTCKGNIFGEYALKMKDSVNEGEVYTFSRGSIKMDTYKTPAHAKDSPYSITFNEQSSINLTTNDDSIKNNQSSLRTISDIQNWKVGGEIDVACIIKQVKPESSYTNKENTESYGKRVFIISDPISKMEAEVTLWRDKVSLVDSSFEKRAVILESFKVNEYNSKLSLSGTLKSRIVGLKNHALNKIDSAQLPDFESISHQKREGEQKANIATAKELLAQAESLRDRDVLWSTFRVYINRIKEKGKKWYCGCPSSSCKKAIDEDVIKCPHCGVPVPKPAFRYVLGVQVADVLGTGFLWTTAYDEFASKILSLQSPLPAEKARMYSDEDFAEIGKKCLFQEFKITMNTKIEYAQDTKRIKHNVTSFTLVNPSKEAQSNLEKIKTMMR